MALQKRMHLKARVQIEQAAYLFFARPFLVEFRCDFFPHAALKLMRIRMQLVGNSSGIVMVISMMAALSLLSITAIARCKRRAHVRGVGGVDSRVKTLKGLSTLIPAVISS